MPAGPSKIKILTSRAVATVLDEIGPKFEQQSGHMLSVVSGFGPDLVQRINAGEPFDMFVSLPPIIDALIEDGKLIAETRTDLVRAGTGIEVRAGSPKPKVDSVEEFKRTLLNANSIGYLKISGVPQLIDRLGLTDAIKSKVSMPDTDIVSELVASGELDLGIVFITQILTTPGVELVGPLPDELQFYLVFAAGVSASSEVRDAARDLIKFLMGPVAKPVIKKQGMEPIEDAYSAIE